MSERIQPAEHIVSWLLGYKGNFPFYISLRDQYFQKGTLSPKQIVSVEKAIVRDAEYKAKKSQPKKPVDPSTFSFQPGDQIEIKRWIAKKLAEQTDIDIFFRNLVITKVEAETAKAIKATVRFYPKVANVCHVCGRGLDNAISVATGIGPICAGKFGFDRASTEDAQAIINKLREHSEAVGEVGPIWLPKSQFKRFEGSDEHLNKVSEEIREKAKKEPAPTVIEIKREEKKEDPEYSQDVLAAINI